MISSILCSMTLKDEVTLLDPFTHTKQDREKIMNFDFIKENSTTEREKIMIDESFCTLIAVGGKFLEKIYFKKVLKKIDEIRKITGVINNHCILIYRHFKNYHT